MTPWDRRRSYRKNAHEALCDLPGTLQAMSMLALVVTTAMWQLITQLCWMVISMQVSSQLAMPVNAPGLGNMTQVVNKT